MLQMNGNKVKKLYKLKNKIKINIEQNNYFLLFDYNYIKTLYINKVYIQ